MAIPQIYDPFNGIDFNVFFITMKYGIALSVVVAIVYVAISISIIRRKIEYDKHYEECKTFMQKALMSNNDSMQDDNVLLDRYRELVDEKYIRGLTEDEFEELELLKPRVDAILDKVGM